METVSELDVRKLVPIQRHQILTKLFRELPTGDSFIFTNDHDPKPLYYEFKSLFGDVVGWEYLKKEAREWKVKVTRTEASEGRQFEGFQTLMDLRKVLPKEWKHVVFHRYGMMKVGDTMELIAKKTPDEIKAIFDKKFAGKHAWKYIKQNPEECVVHITKKEEAKTASESIPVVKSFDVRSYPPAQRHEMVFEAFDEIKPGQAFEFVNDHDPKPLYYQIEAENKIPFKWEYVESGPEAWKVKVMKLLQEEA